jgi:hypothetical protein
MKRKTSLDPIPRVSPENCTIMEIGYLFQLWMVASGGLKLHLLIQKALDSPIVVAFIKQWKLAWKRLSPQTWIICKESDLNDVIVEMHFQRNFAKIREWGGLVPQILFDPNDSTNTLRCRVNADFEGWNDNIRVLYAEDASPANFIELRNHTRQLLEKWEETLQFHPFPFDTRIRLYLDCSIRTLPYIERLLHQHVERYVRAHKNEYIEDIENFGTKKMKSANPRVSNVQQKWLEVMQPLMHPEDWNEYCFSSKTTPRFVSGPDTCTEYYSHRYNKHVYIFGEEHTNRLNRCKDHARGDFSQVFPMHTFLDVLIREQYAQGRTLDVFIEVRKLIKEDIKDDSEVLAVPTDFSPGNTLNTLRHYFKPYLTLYKADDPLGFRNTPDGSPMGRFHYTDIRDAIHPEYLIPDQRLTPLERCMHTLTQLAKLKKETTDLETVRDLFAVGQCHTLGEYVQDKNKLIQDWKKFLDRQGVQKQIDKIPYPEIRKHLSDRLHDLNVLYNYFGMVKKLETELASPYTQTFKDIYPLLLNTFDDYMIHITDIYLIARMMKNPDTRYIVIYVGDWHADVYRQWLTQYGFEERKRIVSIDTQCIDITPLQPFFG